MRRPKAVSEQRPDPPPLPPELLSFNRSDESGLSLRFHWNHISPLLILGQRWPPGGAPTQTVELRPREEGQAAPWGDLRQAGRRQEEALGGPGSEEGGRPGPVLGPQATGCRGGEGGQGLHLSRSMPSRASSSPTGSLVHTASLPMQTPCSLAPISAPQSQAGRLRITAWVSATCSTAM